MKSILARIFVIGGYGSNVAHGALGVLCIASVDAAAKPNILSSSIVSFQKQVGMQE